MEEYPCKSNEKRTPEACSSGQCRLVNQLRVAKELRSTKFLAPLWVFCLLNQLALWRNESYWRKAEQDLIHSLENVVNENERPPGWAKPPIIR